MRFPIIVHSVIFGDGRITVILRGCAYASFSLAQLSWLNLLTASWRGKRMDQARWKLIQRIQGENQPENNKPGEVRYIVPKGWWDEAKSNFSKPKLIKNGGMLKDQKVNANTSSRLNLNGPEKYHHLQVVSIHPEAWSQMMSAGCQVDFIIPR